MAEGKEWDVPLSIDVLSRDGNVQERPPPPSSRLHDSRLNFWPDPYASSLVTMVSCSMVMWSAMRSRMGLATEVASNVTIGVLARVVRQARSSLRRQFRLWLSIRFGLQDELTKSGFNYSDQTYQRATGPFEKMV